MIAELDTDIGLVTVESCKLIYFEVKRSRSRGTMARLCRSSEGTQYRRLLLGFPCVSSAKQMLLTADFSMRGFFAVSQRRRGS